MAPSAIMPRCLVVEGAMLFRPTLLESSALGESTAHRKYISLAALVWSPIQEH